MIADELKDENRALSKREAQLEQLKRETANLPTREQLAKFELQNGVDPKYVAFKYDQDPERCVRYAAVLAKQKEQKRERIQSASGNREIPENREEPDAA